MTGMIERVALAIWESHRSMDISARFTTWEQAKEWQRFTTTAFARAAILAMREPTEGMKNAKYGSEEWERVSGYLDSLDAETVYQAMIDAALAEDVK